jgi:hypothetical protein
MRTIWCIIFLLIATTSYAQKYLKHDERNYIILGIEGGLALCDLRSDEVESDYYYSRTLWTAGMIAGFNFNSKCAIISGIYYDKKGAGRDMVFSDSSGNEIGEGKIRENFEYVTLPLLFRYTFEGNLFFINAGAFASMLVNQEFDADVPGEGNVTIERTDDYQQFDFGISAGLGISKELGSNWILSAEIRDNFGLADVNDNSYGIKPLYTNMICLKFGVGYLF